MPFNTNRLECVYTQHKKYLQLYRDAEWDGEDTEFYKSRVDHYKKLIDERKQYEPKF